MPDPDVQYAVARPVTIKASKMMASMTKTIQIMSRLVTTWL